jgi:hypothetical protein
MRSQIVMSAATLLSCVGVIPSIAMLRSGNRPKIFTGAVGDFFFFLVASSIVFCTGSMILWSLLKIPWYLDLSLIACNVLVFLLVARYVPKVVLYSAIGPILSAFGLIVLHNLAWSLWK